MQDKMFLLEKLKKIKENFINEMPNDFNRLIELCPEIINDKKAYDEFYQIVHKFSGKCGMFELQKLSDLFQHFELQLKPFADKQITKTDLLIIKTELYEIKKQFEDSIA